MRLLQKCFLPLLFAAGLQATPIITVISQGNTPGDFSDTMNGPDGFVGYFVGGWTTGANSYTNVTITALLEGQDPDGDTIDAYLDTAIGPGTTVADEVASNFNIPVSSTGYTSVTLFTGLTLNANTSYYLTLAPDGSDSISWGIDDSQPKPTVDTGVTEIDGQFCTEDGIFCAPYPPASDFSDEGVYPIFSVVSLVSNGTSTVPEPASGALLAIGLVAGGLLHRLRRK